MFALNLMPIYCEFFAMSGDFLIEDGSAVFTLFLATEGLSIRLERLILDAEVNFFCAVGLLGDTLVTVFS